MRTIPVKVHTVADASSLAMPFPADEIRTVFRSAGVDLQFTAGMVLASDPALSVTLDYKALNEQLHASDPAFGHLVVGLDNPQMNPNVAGELFDAETRGMANVYTRSSYILNTRELGFAQTAAHELGHLLNLAHEDHDLHFDSTMDQAQDRDQDVGLAWDLAAKDAAAHPPSFFTPVERPPHCYPFALAARTRLNTLPDASVLPWRSRFDRPQSGAEDRWAHDPGLTVRLEGDAPQVGAPLAFIVSHRETRLVRASPPELGPAFGTLIVEVRRPDGATYRHRPRSLACLRGSEAIGPGDERAWTFCTVRGPKGDVFDEPGPYEVTVVAPQLGACSAPLAFEVTPAAADDLLPGLLDGGRARGARGWRRRARAALEKRLDPLSRSYLALRLLRHARSAEAHAELAAAALAPGAAGEVRQAALLHQLKALRRRRELTRARFEDLVATHMDRLEHRPMHKRFDAWFE